jgi:hypothetical protein
MALSLTDSVQLCLYLRYAEGLLERDHASQTRHERDALQKVVRRLTPGGDSADVSADPAAEAGVLRAVLDEVAFLVTKSGRCVKTSLVMAMAILEDRAKRGPVLPLRLLHEPLTEHAKITPMPTIG